jgi:hypothetical protein
MLEVLRLVWAMAAVRKLLEQPLRSQLRAIVPGLAGGSLASLVMIGLVWFQPPRTLPLMLIELTIPSAVYAAYHIFRGELNRTHISRLRDLLSKSPDAKPTTQAGRS